MNFQLETEQTTDTTFVDLSKNQIKLLHDEIFGQTVVNKVSMDAIVKLELTYIPFLFFIIIMVTAINLRWNKAYKRVMDVAKKKELTEETKHKLIELKIQKLNIYDRFFVYIVIWGSSLYIDSILLFAGITPFPYVSIPVIIAVISKKLKRLSQTSNLLGYDDSDIAENFDKILSDMIVTPLIQAIADRIRNIINSK